MPFKTKTRVTVCLASVWIFIFVWKFMTTWRTHNATTPVSKYVRLRNLSAARALTMKTLWVCAETWYDTCPNNHEKTHYRHKSPHTQTHTVTLPPDKRLWCVPACVKLDKSVFFRGPLRGWNEKNVPHNGGKFLHCQRAAAVGLHNLNLHFRGSPSMLLLLFSNQSAFISYYPRGEFLGVKHRT